MKQVFLEPIDVLHLRGNKLFGGAGDHAEALMPPWPSLAAGAVRSRLLADAGVDIGAFARGEPSAPETDLARSLGSPAAPGEFRVTGFTLARRAGSAVEPMLPLPADVVVTRQTLDDAAYLSPRALPDAIRSSFPLPLPPVLATGTAGKPLGGLWLTAAGWQAYLAHAPIVAAHLLPSSALWATDPRLGIALDGTTRTAATGMLYTAEAVALASDVGFLVGVAGADAILPDGGLLRLGGDGRGAALAASTTLIPEPDWSAIAAAGRFKLVLATPGIFEHGWRLPGFDAHDIWHGPDGCTARLVSAAVPRSQTVSGWDIARWQPKAALRAAPVGSVYWFDEFNGSPDALRKLAAEGFWSLSPYPDAQRRAEGFNNLLIAAWPQPS